MSHEHEIRRYLAARHIHVAKLSNEQLISDKFRVEAPCEIHAQIELNTEIAVGAYTGIYGGTLRHSRIGRYCSIARGFTSGMDNHPTDRISSSMVSYVDDIHGWASYNGIDVERFRADIQAFESVKGTTDIGNDVWIGYDVFVASGIKIGDGAVVAARSVVTHDVGPYEIVAGIPAKCIRMRFSDKLIERCINCCWWDYNLYRYSPKLMLDPESFLDEVERDIASGLRPDAYREVVTGSDLKTMLKDH